MLIWYYTSLVYLHYCFCCMSYCFKNNTETVHFGFLLVCCYGSVCPFCKVHTQLFAITNRANEVNYLLRWNSDLVFKCNFQSLFYNKTKYITAMIKRQNITILRYISEMLQIYQCVSIQKKWLSNNGTRNIWS